MVGKLQLKLKRRPTIETLSRNGYYKDEPCFGNDLNNTVMHDIHFDVPKVLVESVKFLESHPMYMKSLGLYRISGSHTVIQKLRYKVNREVTSKNNLPTHSIDNFLQINANNYKLLWEQTDPNNVTGLIKLFFRELRNPLISLEQIKDTIPKEEYNFFAGSYHFQSEKNNFSAPPFIVSTNKNRNDFPDSDKDDHYRVIRMRALIDKLSPKYRSTLKYFIEHLKRFLNLSI